MKIERLTNLFPDHPTARYNLAAWQAPDSDSIHLIGREVIRAGANGEPDNGILKYFESRNGVITTERTVWQFIESTDGVTNLEDPRALRLPDERVLIGLTAVIRNEKGLPTPYPAFLTIGSQRLWQAELPPYTVVKTFGSGKDVTPVGLDDKTFFFRPDGDLNNHKLRAFSLEEDGPQKLSDIDFPTDLDWAEYRIGTTISPIWLNDQEALFIIHGITRQVIDGVKKYVYSLGRAKLTRRGNNFSVVVAPEPILTPDDFLDHYGQPLVGELHPELRRVVYSCGGILRRDRKDILAMYVNVGDKTTYEVEFSLSELQKDLF